MADEETDKTETENTQSESNEETTPPRRPELVWLEDSQIHVATFRFSMSSRFKWLLATDIMLVTYIAAQFTYLALQKEGWKFLTCIIASGAFVWLVAALKFVGDIRNWLFTKNIQNEQIAKWYVEDMGKICRDLINAGADYASEKVAEAKGEKIESVAETETKDSQGVLA